MSAPVSAVKLPDGSYWVGAIDWALRSFHGYATPRGTTYNAYLVVGDARTALIDTVKAPFRGELLARISSVPGVGRVDVIVSNHSEMDHSGSLAEVARALEPERVVASPTAMKTLREHFDDLPGLTPIKEGEALDLGGAPLRFAEPKLLHWPESMVTWCPEERVLFSQDIFGLHYATGERFDDEVDRAVLFHEAATYYANIILPMAGTVLKGLEKLAGLGIEWRLIANDHGPIWRSFIREIQERYRAWSEGRPSRKAVVLYDTMWGSTEQMARAVAEGLIAGGSPVRVLPMQGTERADVAMEVLEAGALIVGSPTINGTLFPSLADPLAYLRGLKPRGLVGAVFGSSGWAPLALQQLRTLLEEMKVEIVAENLNCRFVPTADDLLRCRSLGEQVAAVLARKG